MQSTEPTQTTIADWYFSLPTYKRSKVKRRFLKEFECSMKTFYRKLHKEVNIKLREEKFLQNQKLTIQ